MADKKIENKSKPVKEKGKLASFFSGISKYFRACIGEVKKIVWPTPKVTFKNMGIVLVVIAIVGLFIYGFDRGLYALLSLVMDISVN